MKPWVACVAILAASLAGCLDRVDARVYAYNGTDRAEPIHVVVARSDGGTVLDEERVIAAAGSTSDSVLLGHIRGREGTYRWSVEFGNRTQSMEERLEDHMVTMNVGLMPDRLDVGFSLA